MRRSLWSFAAVVLAFGALAMVGSTAISAERVPLGLSGVVLTLGGLYLLAALAIRKRAWKRLRSADPTVARVDRLAGRRVF
jgi:hypothetical protein